MNNIDALLHYDSLLEAEKITGENYKKSDKTVMLGMALAMRNSAAAEEAITKMDDTPFSCSMDTYLRIVQEEGFKLIFFRHGKKSYETTMETQYIFWHEDGILLNCDTYKGNRNGANVYFNWKGVKTSMPERGSGGLECQLGLNIRSVPRDMLFFAGHIDARQAIRYELKKLRQNGTFMKQWKNTFVIHLTAHWDWREKHGEFDSQKHTAEIIERLPKHVRDAITPKPFDVFTLPTRLRKKFTKNPKMTPFSLWNKTYAKAKK